MHVALVCVATALELDHLSLAWLAEICAQIVGVLFFFADTDEVAEQWVEKRLRTEVLGQLFVGLAALPDEIVNGQAVINYFEIVRTGDIKCGLGRWQWQHWLEE